MFTPYSEILAVFTSFNESEDYDKVEVEKIGKYDSFVAWLNVQAMAAEAPESIAGLVLHSLYVVVLAASNWEGLKRNVLQLRGELETDLHETYVRWRRDMLQQWALKPSFRATEKRALTGLRRFKAYEGIGKGWHGDKTGHQRAARRK